MMHIVEQGKREREKDSKEQDNNHSRSKKVPNKTVNMYPLRLMINFFAMRKETYLR